MQMASSSQPTSQQLESIGSHHHCSPPHSHCPERFVFPHPARSLPTPLPIDDYRLIAQSQAVCWWPRALSPPNLNQC